VGLLDYPNMSHCDLIIAKIDNVATVELLGLLATLYLVLSFTVSILMWGAGMFLVGCGVFYWNWREAVSNGK
jgi:hypothetical protein